MTVGVPSPVIFYEFISRCVVVADILFRGVDYCSYLASPASLLRRSVPEVATASPVIFYEFMFRGVVPHVMSVVPAVSALVTIASSAIPRLIWAASSVYSFVAISPPSLGAARLVH